MGWGVFVNGRGCVRDILSRGWYGCVSGWMWKCGHVHLLRNITTENALLQNFSKVSSLVSRIIHLFAR